MAFFAPLLEPTARRVLEGIVTRLPIATAVFDRDMRYLAANAKWLAAIGRGAAERDAVLGRTYAEVHPNQPTRYDATFESCLRGETHHSELDTFDVPGGGRIYTRWTAAPWEEAPGVFGGVVVYTENITEQVETRRRLEERESMIRDLFEQSPIGLNLCRMDGLWLESNPAFLRIIGYSREEADGGLSYWQLTPRKYDADEAQQLELLRTVKRYGPYEKEFIRKDGSLVPVRLNGFIVEREGEQFIWSLIEDMTAQRALEAKLEEERVRAIQVSKLATMGEMAASFAHEINNPLGIISAFSHLLRPAVERGDSEQIAEAIEAIQSATDRAGKIVRGLGRFAREAQRDPPEKLSIAALVEDALVLCRSRVEDRGVELVVQISSPASVEGRLVELSQVLVNLINNAVDAARSTEQKGWIRVTAQNDPSAPFVVVAVEDSGPGVAASDVSSIFRSFFTTKKAGEGTGLGLSISRSIVERHGGTLTYDASSKTTRFVVRLPRVES